MDLIWQLSTLLMALLCVTIAGFLQRARKELEQVNKERQRFVLLWKHLPDIVTEIDCDGRILDVNNIINGYERKRLIGSLSTDHLSPEFAEVFLARLKSAIETRQPQSYEMSIPVADGSRAVLSNQLIPVVVDNELQNLLVISTDVTEQIQARGVLEQQRDDAEQANLAKSRFLASMSHEIRTPMNGLLGMVSLMEQTSLNEEQLGFLKVIQSSSDHLLAVINDILDISKIEANKLAIEEEAFNVRTMVDDLLGMVSAKAKEKSLALQSFVEDGMPDVLMGDAVRIRQILMNFLTNAIKFTNHGHVLLRLVVVSRQGENVHLRFSVEDSGIGIEASKAMHLFDEYTFAHGKLSTMEGGTGLGLSISRRLAQLMSGKVGVISTPEVGSNFWLDLHLDVASREVIGASTDSPVAFAELPIWIADELRVNRALVVSVARGLGAPQQEFSNKETLLEALKNQRPAILILSKRLFESLQDDWALLQQEQIHIAVTYPDTINFDPSELLKNGISAYWDWPIGQKHLAQLLTNMALNQDRQQLISPYRRAVKPALQDDELLNGKRILLAEDNPVNQKVASHMLKRMGCDIIIANNGEEALQKLQSESFDLVLMDCHMPVMDGLEATREIRHELNLDLPVLALSADVMAEQKKACVEAGMNDYLAKPVKFDELRQALQQYLA
ncbi:response regulator [Bacterioplanoides sp.]|uniref:response regulator n=1 Tax=Bacterioplanoides sp. TaxID=2066072 RepID=UPI003B5C28DE